ncbi:MAG: hypothetical protein V4736_02290, partial [Bdellovibrionota bacterium]
RLTDLAQACLRFTPQITLSDRAVFLEIAACHRLYSEHNVLLRIQVLLKRFKLSARVQIADDIPTALALAVFNLRNPMDLPVEALAFYHSPFKASETLHPMILALKRLGVTKLEEFRALPHRAIVTKFGKEGLTALHQLENAVHIPWLPYKPQEKIKETQEVDHGYLLRDFEPILFLMKTVMDRALLRLRGQGKLAAQVKIVLDQEAYSTVKEPKREWILAPSFPQGSVISLLPMMKEKVERDLQKNPLQAPLTGIHFEILQAVPGQARQKDFLSRKEEEDESFKSIAARLTERLGREKVFFAAPMESYLPEKSWQKTLEEPVPISIPLPERPLRLLKPAQPLSKIDEYLVHAKKRWKILEMEGPERITGEWWTPTEQRDYYRIATEEGEELWIYALPDSENYFLHGIFD